MNLPARYLLDTNVISETRKKRPEPAVMSLLSSTASSRLLLSALTIGELRRGVEAKRRTDPPAARALAEWLEGLETIYADRILPVDSTVADRWGRLTADRPRPVVDTLLAATALVHELVFVTRNVQDVDGTGVSALNPWAGDPSPRDR